LAKAGVSAPSPSRSEAAARARAVLRSMGSLLAFGFGDHGM
jgi:hypothetical protein